jgi:hypothetical protein
MTRTARTPTRKRAARKTPAAAKAVPAAKRKQQARAQLPRNPVAAKAVDKDLAEWEGRVRSAKTPIVKAHTQAVLDRKRQVYGRPARKQRGR